MQRRTYLVQFEGIRKPFMKKSPRGKKKHDNVRGNTPRKPEKNTRGIPFSRTSTAVLGRQGLRHYYQPVNPFLPMVVNPFPWYRLKREHGID